ncbi:MAG: T9SS type A sorting domain-containing protein [Bacteroidetes bacterium]|nr:T9SS type A sorting domain-containing protein [Bacteroidota bacterium]
MKILTSSLIFVLIVICLIPFYGIAQSYKNISLTNNTSEDQGVEIIKNENNEYFILSNIRPVTNSLSRLGITKTDSLFNPIFTKLLGDSSVNYFAEGLSITKDSSIIVVSSSVEYIPTYHYFITIIKINYFGDTIWTTNVKDSNNHLFLKLIHTSGDSLFLAGSTWNSTSNKFSEGLFYVLNHKTNSVIRTINYSDNQPSNMFFIDGVYNNKRKTFLLYGAASNDTINNIHKPIFLECNTNGSIVNTLAFNDTINISNVQMVSSKTNGNIFIGFERFSTNQFSGYIYFKIDSLNKFIYFKRIYNGKNDLDFYSSFCIDSSESVILTSGPNTMFIDRSGDISALNLTFQNVLYPFAGINYYKGFTINDKAYFIGNIRFQLSSNSDIAILETDLLGAGCTNIPLFETSNSFQLANYLQSVNLDSNFTFNYSSGLNINSHFLTRLNLCPNTSANEQTNNFKNAIKLGPNPFYNDINISSSESINKIIITSIEGKLINEININPTFSINLNLNYLKAGVYIIKLFNNASIANLKIIKL